jgi:hypothetical protein
MNIIKCVAVTLDLIFGVIISATIFFGSEKQNPLSVAFFTLMEICFVVNAAMIW